MDRKIKNLFRSVKIERIPDRMSLGLLLTPILITVVLLVIEYYGIQSAFYRHFANGEMYQSLDANDLAFAAQLHFSLACLVMMVIVPLIFHFLFPLSEHYCFYGLSLRSVAKHFPVYGSLLLVMLPIVWIVSGSPAFFQFYPMYKPQGYSDWLIYELVYMMQFIAVEFFFRGFTLFRIERIAGLYAIVIMVIPYGLLHIHKPFPEALGSIIAGCVLGFLAIKTRSIWPGFFVHCGVALSMDVFAMHHSGRIVNLLPW